MSPETTEPMLSEVTKKEAFFKETAILAKESHKPWKDKKIIKHTYMKVVKREEKEVWVPGGVMLVQQHTPFNCESIDSWFIAIMSSNVIDSSLCPLIIFHQKPQKLIQINLNREEIY